MQPNIVFLDEYSLGDADLGSIRALGNYTGYRTTVREEVADRCREADVVITNKVVFRRETLRQLPRLRLICVAATGMNHIDLEAAAELGIAVKNAVGYSTHAVTETTIGAAIGLLLVAAMVSRHGALASTSVVVVDALISIPTVLIALMLSVPFGASAAVIIAACGLAYGLNLARILRPAAMLAARSDYVESALWSGASSLRVFFTHIVPNTVPVLCVQLSMSAGTSLLAEAGLTYLGVGVGAGVPSWGHSLATSVKFISIYPMAVVWPGLVVTLMVIALNLFGDALRDAIDPLTNPALRQGEATHVESEERA